MRYRLKTHLCNAFPVRDLVRKHDDPAGLPTPAMFAVSAGNLTIHKDHVRIIRSATVYDVSQIRTDMIVFYEDGRIEVYRHRQFHDLYAAIR